MRYLQASALALISTIAISGTALGQAVSPTNSLRDPYRAIENWGSCRRAGRGALPAGSASIPIGGACLGCRTLRPICAAYGYATGSTIRLRRIKS